MVEKNVFGILDKIQDMFYSMTIEDMIKVLPETIITKYYGKHIRSHIEINKKVV